MLDINAPLLGLEIIPEDGHLTLAAVFGLAIPVGPNQAMQVPFAIVRMNIDKPSAIAKATEMLAAAEALPDPPKQSDIIIPGGSVDLDSVAQASQQFRS